MRLVYLAVLFLCFTHALWAQKVVLTLVYDKETLFSAKEFERIIDKYFPAVEIKYLPYQKQEARRLEKKFAFLRLPFGVFSSSLKQNDKMLFSLAFNRLIVPLGEHYIVNPAVFLSWGEKILGRKRMKGRLDIFSMGFCPACRQAEYQIARYIKSHSLSCLLYVKFVGGITPAGKITSLHGAKEVEEDIIEKIVESHFYSRLLDFLIKKKDELEGGKILASLGIKEKAWRKYYAEAARLVREDIKLADSLGINSTPTFLWENVFATADLHYVLELIKKNCAGNGKSAGK